MTADVDPRATRLPGVPPEPGAAKPDPILVAEGVTKTFGGLHAVQVSGLEVQRGTITALIGPNGAGKTTLFNLLTGFDRADAGRWSFEGRPLAGLPAYRSPACCLLPAAELQVLQDGEEGQRFGQLEGSDHPGPGSAVGGQQAGERFFTALVHPLWRARETTIERQAEEMLARFGLSRMRDEFAGTLSGGQRKLLELARALMAQPAMIMLDEPTAGVNPALTQSLLRHILQLRDEGMTILFVEHDMDVVMGISDWVVCMAEGRVIAEGPPASIGSNHEVIDAYLGAHHGRRGGGEG